MAALTDAEIQQRLASLERWHRGEDAGTATIGRELELPNFASAIALVNRIAELAEAANHHPDILVYSWNKVRLTLSTHSHRGLTDADFALAREIDAAV
jgi:4a-hydroxytetrahydrobiopterin dehydratase